MRLKLNVLKYSNIRLYVHLNSNEVLFLSDVLMNEAIAGAIRKCKVNLFERV